MDTKNKTSKDDFNATSHKTDVICRSFKISRNDFFENFIKDVKILTVENGNKEMLTDFSKQLVNKNFQEWMTPQTV